jgi:hypothetical protein
MGNICELIFTFLTTGFYLGLGIYLAVVLLAYHFKNGFGLDAVFGLGFVFTCLLLGGLGVSAIWEELA